MPSLQPYVHLLRLHHPIGIWLLLFPCWWGQFLGTAVYGQVPNLWYTLLFALGACVMRGAGCTINDILDHDIDSQVERTRTRPIPSGQITIKQALLFFVFLLLLGFFILLFFNTLTLILGVWSLIFVVAYPLMKRITWWPQVFLGVTFNWGILLGWTSQTSSLELTPFLLYLGCIFWTVGYDTIYAHQDKEDDVKIGIKSTALLWGERSRVGVFICYAVAMSLWFLTGILAELSVYFLGLAVSGWLLFKQYQQWDMNDPDNCLVQFRSNQWIGLALLSGLLLENLLIYFF